MSFGSISQRISIKQIVTMVSVSIDMRDAIIIISNTRHVVACDQIMARDDHVGIVGNI